jgi:hypothetical protein
MGTLIARMMVPALESGTLRHTSPILGTFVVTIGILPL